MHVQFFYYGNFNTISNCILKPVADADADAEDAGSAAGGGRGARLLATARRIEAHCIREVAVPAALRGGGAGAGGEGEVAGPATASVAGPAAAATSSVLAFECPGYLGIGGKVWDSTYVLFRYLQRRPELIRRRRVVELGSGTGLAGNACPMCIYIYICILYLYSISIFYIYILYACQNSLLFYAML
jgi:hypothetical protein